MYQSRRSFIWTWATYTARSGHCLVCTRHAGWMWFFRGRGQVIWCLTLTVCTCAHWCTRDKNTYAQCATCTLKSGWMPKGLSWKKQLIRQQTVLGSAVISSLCSSGMRRKGTRTMNCSCPWKTHTPIRNDNLSGQQLVPLSCQGSSFTLQWSLSLCQWVGVATLGQYVADMVIFSVASFRIFIIMSLCHTSNRDESETPGKLGT